MPRGFHPILLTFALAPASVGALGLGDIHVDSALNEPLSAQIEIVGASLDDLTDLRASIATLEIFQHYGAERPAYLNSATFKIGHDVQGRPVLNVQSREPFVDPLVSFLVDLRWRNSELVRDYSLLLDPAGLSAARRAAEQRATTASVAVPGISVPPPSSISAPVAEINPAAPAAAAPAAAAPAAAAPSPSAAPSAAPAPMVASGMLHRITAKDTLRAIVRHAGARSETEVQRMMIATFRANPSAFDGNINRLHRGVVLQLPTSAGMDAISPAEARHEVDEQMMAWRSAGRSMARPASAAVLPAPTAATATPAAPSAPAASSTQPDAALTGRLYSLEQQLVDLHQQMARESAYIQELKQAAIQPVPAAPSSSAAPASPERTRVPMNFNTLLAFGALLLGAGLALYAYLRRRLQRPAPLVETPVGSTVAAAPVGALAAPDLPALAESPAMAIAAAELRPAVAGAPARGQAMAAADTGKGMTIEVDTEALERSYLESLGFNTSGLGKNADVTATLESLAPAVAPAVKPAAFIAEMDLSDIHEADIGATDVNTAVLKVDATPTGVPTSSVTTELDFDLSDLDATAQHVHMGSALNDTVEVSERRTNVVDVLKMAIERDPHRRDLRMKLVETYYTAATANRRGFMEAVRKLAREREHLSAEEWAKVVLMGRDLAPDDMMFADDLVNNEDKDDVAA